MPEYSSTTITPSDGVQVPGMNGSTSGNFLLSALKSYILSEKGLANGLASLDGNGKLLSSQLPDLADDVIVVASYASLPATGTAGKIYITADNNKMYRWDPDLATPDYVELSIDLSDYATKADLLDGTIVVKEAEIATKDEDGNNIKATYETKADASDLKSAIQGNSQRIENLEVAVSGSLVQTNVLTDPPSMANVRTITNANEILPWAILKRVGARATQFNQFMNDSPYNASVSKSGSTVTVTWDNSAGDSKFGTISTAVPLGHKVLVSVNIVSVSVTNFTKIRFGNGVNIQTSVGQQSFIATPSGLGSVALFVDASSFVLGDNFVYKDFNVFDLTAMGEYDSTLTDAQNIAKIRAKFPASYYPYTSNPSIIPLNPSAFKVVGFNKWDGTGEDGRAMGGTGNTYADADCFATWFIPVRPQEYYFNDPVKGRNWVDFYDINKTFIRQVANNGENGVVVPDNAFFARFTGRMAYKSTYCVNLYIPSLNGQHKDYTETTIDTSDVPEGYVDSEHYNYKENVLVDGVMRGAIHVVIGEYTFTGNETWTANGSSRKTDVLTDLIKHYTNQALAIILCEGLEVTTPAKLYDGTVTSGIASYDGYIRVAEGDVANMAGKKMYYELATESVTDCDPIPNIPCEDGTTVTAVTPQTDLVNSIDVPSTIAYMTKISS